jgi:adenine phosphoribosyltransferase
MSPGTSQHAQAIRQLIRDIPDFPKPGILFRDITPLLADSRGLALACEAMAEPFRDANIDVVVGTESRGFIFGAAIARLLNAGFVPVRKPGKLPGATIAEEYALEYGADRLEIHRDAVRPGQRVLMVDDLLATGGTMKAACRLVEKLGGDIAGISFLIELAFLHGREQLKSRPVHVVISY